MSRSHLMSWVASAVVHTGMLVLLGAALTAFPVVAPEVPGDRIVVMSSRADVAAPDAALREPSQTPPIQLLETPELAEPSHQKPQSSPEPVGSDSEQLLTPSPQPLELAMSSVKLPNLLRSQRLKRSQSRETGAGKATRPRRSSRPREVSDSDFPPLERRWPDMLKVAQAEPIDVPPKRPPAPAELQPTSSSTARQQSANSVAQTVGTTPAKPARPLSNPNPTYPPEAVQQGLEGRVILSVTIAASGEVTKVTVAKSCGYDVLDQAALDAVCRWRFSPATRGGKPVQWTARLPIRFRL
jgi:periplasmic protein TonB